jgi:DNA-binding LacI/PurR family transcriptional regulator
MSAVGAAAARMLLSAVENPDQSRLSQRLQAELVIRKSTAPIPIRR